MKIEFKKKIGLTEFTFHVESAGIKDFFEKVSEYEDIPTKGPNGEEDLRIAFRTTKQGHKYYSVVCESAKQEFKFGQSTDNVSMFPKGWEPMYEGNNDQAQGNGGGLAQQQQNYVNNQHQKNYQQNNGLGQQNNQQQNYQAQAPAPAPAPQNNNQQQTYQAPPQNNQQYNTQAPPAGNGVPPQGNNPAVNDVLAKYGIGQ